MIDKIKQALDDIRPSLQADGGDIEFVNFSDDGIVEVRLTGACFGCPMSQITLKQGVEKYLKDTLPEVKAVEAV
ncbi:MAG: NifU family protein [Spirochaetia bacterium]|jgi:Fe-S cluster biogenesis protein NfuA|nr:NifU family protein [Spirochaetia bacterium]